MANLQVYEGTFEENAFRYGNELADRRVKVTVVELENEVKEIHASYNSATKEERFMERRELGASPDRLPTTLKSEALDCATIYAEADILEPMSLDDLAEARRGFASVRITPYDSDLPAVLLSEG